MQFYAQTPKLKATRSGRSSTQRGVLFLHGEKK